MRSSTRSTLARAFDAKTHVAPTNLSKAAASKIVREVDLEVGKLLLGYHHGVSHAGSWRNRAAKLSALAAWAFGIGTSRVVDSSGVPSWQLTTSHTRAMLAVSREYAGIVGGLMHQAAYHSCDDIAEKLRTQNRRRMPYPWQRPVRSW